MVENCLSGYNSCIFAYGQVYSSVILEIDYESDLLPLVQAQALNTSKFISVKPYVFW